ncbi:GNAT family N-acetyltransferase, partial [Elizabethkingia meningoseptica]
SAQNYLLKFYGSLGFEPVGESYLEDNIPHTEMLKSYSA